MSIQLGKYTHYKGKQYEVLGIVNHSETLEKLVLYKALYTSPDYKKDALWVRPLAMFTENIIINDEKVPRFKKIESTVK